MGIIITLTGVQPACSECGICLCWELSQSDYEDKRDFWDNWCCRQCYPNYLRDYRRRHMKGHIYLGISYLSDGDQEWTKGALKFWAKHYCPDGSHVYDEVLSNDRHYLHCDACGKTIDINPDGTEKLVLDKNTQV